MRNIYLIKDLARLTGHSIYTIKYYLKIGLIKEFGRSPQTNFRYFSDATAERLKQIRKLRRRKISIAEIQKIIRHR
jgi:DNA-binding transcriptional MerR regulator